MFLQQGQARSIKILESIRASVLESDKKNIKIEKQKAVERMVVSLLSFLSSFSSIKKRFATKILKFYPIQNCLMYRKSNCFSLPEFLILLRNFLSSFFKKKREAFVISYFCLFLFLLFLVLCM
jgi:hypothetical protein